MKVIKVIDNFIIMMLALFGFVLLFASAHYNNWFGFVSVLFFAIIFIVSTILEERRRCCPNAKKYVLW